MTKEIPAQGGWMDRTRATARGSRVTRVHCQLEHRKLGNTHAPNSPSKNHLILTSQETSIRAKHAQINFQQPTESTQDLITREKARVSEGSLL